MSAKLLFCVATMDLRSAKQKSVIPALEKLLKNPPQNTKTYLLGCDLTGRPDANPHKNFVGFCAFVLVAF